jgi:hypothetical protein
VGWIIGTVLLAAQASALPPPYPREGATKVFENDRVQVWDIAWLKRRYPLHHHVYDLVGVYYSPGDRMIISPSGERRPVSTAAWDTAFQRRGLTHTEEGASATPLRAVFIEIKDEPRAAPIDSGGLPPFPDARGTPLVDNDRVTAWEFVPAPSTQTVGHRHRHDTVVVTFAEGRPTVSFAAAGMSHSVEGVARAERVYAFEIK